MSLPPTSSPNTDTMPITPSMPLLLCLRSPTRKNLLLQQTPQSHRRAYLPPRYFLLPLLSNMRQPFSLKSAMVFCATGAALVFYFTYEKARLERKRVTEMSKGYGKPKVGGPFELKDLEGRTFTEKELRGKYNLVRTRPSQSPLFSPSPLAISRLVFPTPAVLPADGAYAQPTDLLRLHPLPGYLPGRTRQNVHRHLPHQRLRPQHPPPHLHHLRPRPRQPRGPAHLSVRIPPLPFRINGNLGRGQERL